MFSHILKRQFTRPSGFRAFSTPVNFTIKDFADNSWKVNGEVGQTVMFAGVAAGVPF